MMPLTVKQAVNWSQKLLTFYKGTKSGIDNVDQIYPTYNVAWSSRYWPMVILRFWESYITLTYVTIFKTHELVLYAQNYLAVLAET
jgi:hypothetical protein